MVTFDELVTRSNTLSVKEIKELLLKESEPEGKLSFAPFYRSCNGKFCAVGLLLNKIGVLEDGDSKVDVPDVAEWQGSDVYEIDHMILDGLSRAHGYEEGNKYFDSIPPLFFNLPLSVVRRIQNIHDDNGPTEFKEKLVKLLEPYEV